jgi:hypothetical protein
MGISNPERVFLTLVVGSNEEVDQWHHYLMGEGVRMIRPPQHMSEYKIYNGLYLDPMGYTIEMQAFDVNARPEDSNVFKALNSNRG